MSDHVYLSVPSRRERVRVWAVVGGLVICVVLAWGMSFRSAFMEAVSGVSQEAAGTKAFFERVTSVFSSSSTSN